MDSQDSWRMRLSRRHRPLPSSSHAQVDTTTNGQTTDHPSGRDQRAASHHPTGCSEVSRAAVSFPIQRLGSFRLESTANRNPEPLPTYRGSKNERPWA